jgi:hypothetical protein
MKKYDKYIQDRIFKVYTDNKKGNLQSGMYQTFDEFAKRYGEDGLEQTTRWLIMFGCGKQRATDYAHYIEQYLKG